MNGGGNDATYGYKDGDGLDAGTTAFWTMYAYDEITIHNRDITLIYVQLQHDNHNQMYRIAINAYEPIAADPTAGTAAVTGKASIFIELLE